VDSIHSPSDRENSDLMLSISKILHLG